MSDSSVGTFKTMVLNMSLGGGMTDRQIEYVVTWVKNNVPPTQFNTLAEIAWQYDANELSSRLSALYSD